MKITDNRQNEDGDMRENTQLDLALTEAAARLVKSDAQYIDLRTQSRLKKARLAAVEHAVALENGTTLSQSGGVLQWLGPYFSQHRVLSTTFAIMLVTFFAVQQFGLNDNLEHSDAYLLAADLPPEAFADKGFNTWLVATHE